VLQPRGGHGWDGFIENNKALCMLSVLINTHLLLAARSSSPAVFLASSACVYAAAKQTTTENPGLKEADAYPAMPEDGYGWEKLFSERMCRHFREDFGQRPGSALSQRLRPFGTYDGGREKAPRQSAVSFIQQKRAAPRNRDLGRRAADAQLHVTSTTA